MQTASDRFWKRVRKTDDCWLWTGGVNSSGYGKLSVDGNTNFRAHRYSYLIHFGAFDQRLQVCHHCDRPRCVRPDHLFLGTQFENMKDMAAKGRANSCQIHQTHCKRGHPLSGDNIWTRSGSRRRQRLCKTCYRIRLGQTPRKIKATA